MNDKEDFDVQDCIIPSLNQVVGQARAVAVLRTAIDAYFYERSKVGDKQAFPHTLITGPAGCGKSAAWPACRGTSHDPSAG